MMGHSRRVDTVLGTVSYLESAVFLVAAELHSGVAIPIGSRIWAWTHVSAAALPEVLCAGLFAASGYNLLARRHNAHDVAIAAHALGLLGLVLSLAALMGSSGPRPASDALLHLWMLPLVAITLIATWLDRPRFTLRQYRLLPVA